VPVIVIVIGVITGGAGILPDLAAWAIIPREREKASLAENFLSNSQSAPS
jgi:hypothetical protein